MNQPFFPSPLPFCFSPPPSLSTPPPPLSHSHPFPFPTPYRSSLPGLVEKHSRETGGESALQFIALGEKAISENDVAKASANFEKALNLDPKNGESIAHLGLLKVEEGKMEDGITVLGRLEEKKVVEGGLTAYGLSKVLLGLEVLGGVRGREEGGEKEMEVLKKVLEIAGVEREKVEQEGRSLEVVERVMVRVPLLYLQLGDVPRFFFHFLLIYLRIFFYLLLLQDFLIFIITTIIITIILFYFILLYCIY